MDKKKTMKKKIINRRQQNKRQFPQTSNRYFDHQKKGKEIPVKEIKTWTAFCMQVTAKCAYDHYFGV